MYDFFAVRVSCHTRAIFSASNRSFAEGTMNDGSRARTSYVVFSPTQKRKMEAAGKIAVVASSQSKARRSWDKVMLLKSCRAMSEVSQWIDFKFVGIALVRLCLVYS
jgi:hypothetical protein